MKPITSIHSLADGTPVAMSHVNHADLVIGKFYNSVTDGEPMCIVINDKDRAYFHDCDIRQMWYAPLNISDNEPEEKLYFHHIKNKGVYTSIIKLRVAPPENWKKMGQDELWFSATKQEEICLSIARYLRQMGCHVEEHLTGETFQSVNTLTVGIPDAPGNGSITDWIYTIDCVGIRDITPTELYHELPYGFSRVETATS